MKKLLLVFSVSALFVILAFLLFSPMEAWVQESLTTLHANPVNYALLSFTLLALDVVLPVPSSIVMYMNGHVLGVFIGSMLSLAAALLTSMIGYSIGQFVNFKQKSLAKSAKNERARMLLLRFGGLAILITRGIPILAESVSIVCGTSGISFRYYFLMNLLGYLPVVLIYGIFGALGNEGGSFMLSFGCSILISGLFWFAGKKGLERFLFHSTLT